MKSLKINNLKLVILFLVLSISTISSTQAQILSPRDFGAKYTVYQGEIKQYTYSKVQNYGKDYIGVLYLDSKGNIENTINISQGIVFTVVITNITTSRPQTFSFNATISTPNGSIQIFPEFFPFGIIYYSFPNRSALNSYINNTLNVIFNTNTLSFKTDDNFLYVTISSGSSYSIRKYNWHTGWLQYSEDKISVKSNNSVVYDVKVELGSNNFLSNFFNSNLNSILFGLPLAGGGILTLAFINFKRNNKSRLNNDNSQSFLSYIKSDFKKHRDGINKNSIRNHNNSNYNRESSSDINKFLTIIEDILKETKK